MADVITYQRFWQRRDTAANWASVNPVLASGEIGVELTALPDPHKMKIGDGVTAWNDLPYFAGGASGNTGVICCTFNNGTGDPIEANAQADVLVTYACTITQATLLADQTGSITIDVWADIYGNFPPTDADSITSATPPTISSAIKSQDSTLSGWDTSISAGSTLRFNVDSCVDIVRAVLILEVTK